MVLRNQVKEVSVAPDKQAAVVAVVAELEQVMDFLVGLDVKQRVRLSKMGRKNREFMERCLAHAMARGEYLGDEEKLTVFKEQTASGTWLHELDKRLSAIYARVKDTLMYVDAQSYRFARLYYDYVKSHGKNGDDDAQRIAADLAVHFKKYGKQKDEEKPGDGTTPPGAK